MLLRRVELPLPLLSVDCSEGWGGDAKIENNNNNLPKNSIKHLYDCDLKCHYFTILVLFYKFAVAFKRAIVPPPSQGPNVLRSSKIP